MAKFTVQVEYLLPVYKNVVVEADSVEEACEKALQHDDWANAEEDYTSAGPDMIAAVEEGEHRCPTGAVPESIIEKQSAELRKWNERRQG